ncbi:hypothetical protein [Kitasatospora sp. A2-31]|uniref:hypothetical protein n=1 Tax=Kitasatospora sp. A2-31 TaxID=2916414 RepID=UPI001EEE09AD|nr:hypothetical protein [Kitasatospora sp. A2-31]MCG6498892.1 hypothetical protein [Kitasatospora sp. A2-31]MCG6499483.1 hypothetical protein [Kitasatospora sp. A2-31]MCG6500205.1 hypothetical protein [Kitasatospora sp. A2-31]
MRDLYLGILSGKHTDPAPCPELDQLVATHLVAPDTGRPGNYVALDPLSALRDRRTELLRAAGDLIAEAQILPVQVSALAAAYQAAHSGGSSHQRGGVEILTGKAAINERLEGLINTCERELLTAQQTGPRPADLLAVSYQRDLGVLRRRAAMRTIYLPSVRTHAPTARWAQTMTEQGAQVRTGKAFGRAIVIDRQVAFVAVLDPWTGEEISKEQAAVVTDPAMVAAVAAGFERDWARAEPWDGTTEAALLPVHLGILRCLARGLDQDDAAAELNISRRTVNNRLAELRRIAGAATVAQLLYWWARREAATADV